MTLKADDIGQVPGLRLLSCRQTPFEKGEGQPGQDEELLNGLKGAHPEVAETETGFEIEVRHFTGPALHIPGQHLIGAERQVGGHEVPGSPVSTGTFRNEDTDIAGDVVETTIHLAHQIGAGAIVRSGERDTLVPLVLEMLIVGANVFSVQTTI